MNIIQGIEGDDLQLHLRLLGAETLPNCYFVSLVDHYNLHHGDWLSLTITESNKYQTVVFYDLIHTGDVEQEMFKTFINDFEHPNKVYLTVNQSKSMCIGGVEIINWDFMWNRFKAYYTETIPLDLTIHHYCNDYHTVELDFDQTREKLFLSPMGRDYGPRAKLFNIVKDFNGYCSNRSINLTFENATVQGMFRPIPERFYLDSYFSVYVESNSSNTELIHLTEKTFEPLTKGHFILPIANPGTINRVQELGFKLPSFIDYSFDSEPDADKRFDMVIGEFKRLLTLDLPQLYKDNRDILTHNRNCLTTIPYDKRILRIFDV